MLSCVVILALFGMAYGQIDYGRCEWVYGGATDFKVCPSGYVGVGACGNKGQNRCNNQAFGIYCCKMTGGLERECFIDGGGNGEHVPCPFGSTVFGTCGSLDMSRCDENGNRRAITIKCCKSDISIVAATCYWKYGANQGESLFCRTNSGNEEVMTGRCGSETMARCSGNVHAIECCRVLQN